MAEFLKNKAKLIVLAYGVLLLAALIFGIFYMTQYAHIHIAYSLQGGKASYSDDLTIGSFATNMDLFQYFNDSTDSTSPLLTGITKTAKTVVDAGYADTIYKFQTSMSSFNTLILVFMLLSIVCFAVMLIFSNQSRKVYYKDNLFVGILMPFIVIVFNFILMIMNFGLMGDFNANSNLYKTTSFLMNPNIDPVLKQKAFNQGGFNDVILPNTQDISATTYIIATLVFIIVIVVSVLMMVYTVYRYKECAKRRSDIIERAANNND